MGLGVPYWILVLVTTPASTPPWSRQLALSWSHLNNHSLSAQHAEAYWPFCWLRLAEAFKRKSPQQHEQINHGRLFGNGLVDISLTFCTGWGWVVFGFSRLSLHWFAFRHGAFWFESLCAMYRQFLLPQSAGFIHSCSSTSIVFAMAGHGLIHKMSCRQQHAYVNMLIEHFLAGMCASNNGPLCQSYVQASHKGGIHPLVFFLSALQYTGDEPRLPWQQQHQLKMRLDKLT